MRKKHIKEVGKIEMDSLALHILAIFRGVGARLELSVSSGDNSTIQDVKKNKMCWIRAQMDIYGTESQMLKYLNSITNIIDAYIK